MKLTEEMKKMFSEQLPIIATVNEDLTANVGPKRSGRVYDDETIVFNENTAGRTERNIERTGNATIFLSVLPLDEGPKPCSPWNKIYNIKKKNDCQQFFIKKIILSI